MPAGAVDQETLRLLSGIENLDMLLLKVDISIYATEWVARKRGVQASKDFDHMCEEFRRAKKLVQEHLPSVSIPVQVNLPDGY